MVETELLIGHLRSQVRNLQSLLNYLESRERMERADYSYSWGKLRELIKRLKELERFTARRGETQNLHVGWLN
jgi:hypothetical protein